MQFMRNYYLYKVIGALLLLIIHAPSGVKTIKIEKPKCKSIKYIDYFGLNTE